MQTKRKTDVVPAQPEKRRRRSSEEIMDRLIRAAGEEFKQFGFSGATTARIARRAEVTEAQLFRYFESKADLFREAVFKPLNQHFSDFHNRRLAEASPSETVRDMAADYITELQQFVTDHAGMLMSLLVAQTYTPEMTKGLADIGSLAAYFERGAAMMSGRVGENPKVAPKVMVRVSLAAVLGCIMFKDLIFPPGLASEEAFREAVNDFVLDGVNANEDSRLRKTER